MSLLKDLNSELKNKEYLIEIKQEIVVNDIINTLI